MYVCVYVRTYVCTYVRVNASVPTYVCTYVRMYVRTDGRAFVRTYVRKPTCAYARTTLCGTHMSTYVRAQSTSKLFHIWHYYVPRGVFRPPYVSTVRTYPNGRWPLSPPQCTAFEKPDAILAGRLRITARHRASLVEIQADGDPHAAALVRFVPELARLFVLPALCGRTKPNVHLKICGRDLPIFAFLGEDPPRTRWRVPRDLTGDGRSRER